MKVPHQFLAFCVVGTIGFVVDVAILHALAPWLGWYGGRVVSFIGAATATWALNRSFTFSAQAANARYSAWQQYWRYMLAMLGGALVNYLAYTLTLLWSSAPWAPTLGVAMGSIAGLAVNFISARKVAFRTRQSQSPSSSSVEP
jgi:putative flippase GtrA